MAYVTKLTSSLSKNSMYFGDTYEFNDRDDKDINANRVLNLFANLKYTKYKSINSF